MTALALLAVAATAGRATESSPDLARNPPKVEVISVRLLDPPDPHARLTVRYAPDPRLGSTVILKLGKERVVLRDDGMEGDEKAGDHIYSGTFVLDVGALIEREQTVAKLIKAHGGELTVPKFVGRERVGEEMITEHSLPSISTLQAGETVELAATAMCMVPPTSASSLKDTLLVVDPKVVKDTSRTDIACAPNSERGTPGGVWTFAHLMREAAGGSGVTDQDLSKFIERWLAQWTTDQTVNGWTVPRRKGMTTQIITPWKAASKGGAPNVTYDATKAPFRLLAIVNRIDKADSIIYGPSSPPNPGNAGELRFVFGALSKKCKPLNFSVIFEYQVQRADCAGVGQWARDWIALAQLSLGSTAYNAALEALTEPLVKHDAAKPNGSALAQVRTNESSLGDTFPGVKWDMREFHLTPLSSGTPAVALSEDTVKQTPDDSENNTATLASYINANAVAIQNDLQHVPDDYPTAGSHFLGGHSFGRPTNSSNTGSFWNAPGITIPAARFHFSLDTCNGCHAQETGTQSTHVDPKSNPATAAQLSGFLTGETVTDPVDGSTHHFADLDDRVQKLTIAATLDCICQLYGTPPPATH